MNSLDTAFCTIPCFSYCRNGFMQVSDKIFLASPSGSEFPRRFVRDNKLSYLVKTATTGTGLIVYKSLIDLYVPIEHTFSKFSLRFHFEKIFNASFHDPFPCSWYWQTKPLPLVNAGDTWIRLTTYHTTCTCWLMSARSLRSLRNFSTSCRFSVLPPSKPWLSCSTNCEFAADIISWLMSETPASKWDTFCA